MALEAMDAYADWDSESEAAEATRRLRKPSNQSSFKARPAPNAPQYATQAQLAASIARVDGKVKVVADGMSTLNSRVAGLSASIKREAEERKKTGDSQNKDLNQKMQMLALLPLLIPQKSSKLAAGTLVDKKGNDISRISTPDPNSQMDSLLPLLMMSGMGGSGGLGFGGDGSSGSDGSMMMLALVLAMSNK